MVGSSPRCFGCKKALFCGTHKGELCTACDEPAYQVPVTQPSNAMASHFPAIITCLMPARGGLLMAQYGLVPFDATPVPLVTILAPSECQLPVQQEDDTPLPQPGVGSCRMVLKNTPSTILVINASGFAGFQFPTVDNDEVTALRWNLLPSHMPIMDTSMLVPWCPMRNTPSGKKGDYMCACHHVFLSLCLFALLLENILSGLMQILSVKPMRDRHYGESMSPQPILRLWTCKHWSPHVGHYR